MPVRPAELNRPGLEPRLEKLHMEHSSRTIGRGLLSLVAIVAIYYAWSYLIGFLAVVGAAQVYRVWRDRTRGG